LEHSYGQQDVTTNGIAFTVARNGSYLVGIQINSNSPPTGRVHGWIDGSRREPPFSRICVFEMDVTSLTAVITSSIEPVRLLQGDTLTMSLFIGRLEANINNPVYVWFKCM
jgi:hypothetical protein